jgi:glycosyltransferase involved in cell wall biosynthesis
MAREHFSILLIGTQMAIGGAQRGLLDQARWFKSQGCGVAVAFFYDKENLHEKWRQTVDFPIHNLHSYEPSAGLIRQTWNLTTGFWRLWTLLRREKFDVVETFTHDSNVLGLLLAWLARVPVRIATHRGKIEAFPRWRQSLHSLLMNIGVAHTLVAVSENTLGQAVREGVRVDRIIVIPNGVTPLNTLSIDRPAARKSLGLSEIDIFLLSIGRLTYQKGHEYFIQAMSNVVRHFPNVKAGICGDGPLRAQLESQILRLGLSDSMKLLGAWDDISPILVSADIFILPSRWEGISRALMEAMAAGIPVIATRVDGIQNLVTDGVNGLLIPMEDSEKLENSILQLIENPEMRKRLGTTAKTHVLHVHSTDAMCKKYYDLIMSFLNSE